MAWSKKYGTKKEYDRPETELTDARQDITKRVVECMKDARDNGTKYKKGWFVSNEFPYNPITGKSYSGVNILSLLADGYEDPRFIPAGEVAKLYKETEGKVKIKKGEKSSRIVFATVKTEGTGEVDLSTGEEKTSSRTIFKYHPAFNVSQLDGLDIINEKYPRKERAPMNQVQENEFVQSAFVVMKETGLKVERHAAGTAYYQPGTDTIKLPELHRFESEALANRTGLHELGHATGHEKRCDRIQTGGFGSKEYAYEELVAELFSFYMGMHTGVPYDNRTHENHGSYLNSWIDAMTDDSKEAKNYLVTAAAKAFKGYDYVMERVLARGKSDEDKDKSTVAEVKEVEKVELAKPKKKMELAM